MKTVWSSVVVLCVAAWLMATPAMARIDVLSIDKSHQGGDDIEYLDEIEFTIAYSNSSVLTATGVAIVDSLPSELGYVSDNAGGSYSVGSHSVTWNIGTLNIGQSGSVLLTVRCNSAAADQWITNNVDISGSSGPNSGSDTDPLHIVPEPATMGLLAVGVFGLIARRRRRK